MLQQKLQQKLLQKLSPQQIQLIKLLELPTIQLEQRIKKEIEENPALEEGQEEENFSSNEQEEMPADGEESSENEYDKEDEFNINDYISDDDIPSYKMLSKQSGNDEDKKEIPFSVGATFHEFLSQQLGLRNLKEEQRLIADYIIGSIDDDGYLRRDVQAIVDDLAFSQNINFKNEEVEQILSIIQDLDPPGVGAKNLQECLLIQIRKKDLNQPEIALAKEILENHFDEFTKKHYDKIVSRMDISDETLKSAIDIILKLNPKPGSSFSDPHNKELNYVIPDFILENNNGELNLTLNSKNAPELKISRTYANMLEDFSHKKTNKSKQQKEAVTFVRMKLDAAKWFIDAIKQRQNTMLVSMNAIIEFQKEYFLEGNESKLKPMILKDIAERTGLDISTISRVVNSKYIQTNFGIFSLKYFFSEGIQTESGDEVSTREIKRILQECIDIEDKRKPLTDEKLAAILAEKGYKIARRTVAKYREQLNIPVGRLRKSL